MSRIPVNYDCDDDHYDMLNERQNKVVQNNGTFKDCIIFPIGSTVVVHQELGHGAMEQS